MYHSESPTTLGYAKEEHTDPKNLITQPNSRDQFVTQEEAAAYLGVKVRQLETWRSRQRGPRYRKFSKLVRYAVTDLKAFADAATVDPQSVGHEVLE
jgi:hypothetical protein